MTDQDLAEFTEVLTGVAESKGRRNLSEAYVREWWEACKRLDLDTFTRAIRATALGMSYMPDPSAVLQTADRIASSSRFEEDKRWTLDEVLDDMGTADEFGLASVKLMRRILQIGRQAALEEQLDDDKCFLPRDRGWVKMVTAMANGKTASMAELYAGRELPHHHWCERCDGHGLVLYPDPKSGGMMSRPCVCPRGHTEEARMRSHAAKLADQGHLGIGRMARYWSRLKKAGHTPK